MDSSIAAPPRSHAFYYAAGILFLALAKARHVLHGYSSPKPFATTETDRCIDYAVAQAKGYVAKLKSYGVDVAGKRVLELGPGSDLALGLWLARHGARSYVGFDRNNLVAKLPEGFYARVAERTGVDLACLRDGRVAYAARADFDVGTLRPDIDIVVSNAAFEHFDDVERTVRQLTSVVVPGGVACISVDLQTHSRWIRDADPNNIYRYPEWLYRLFYFPGQPNRVRPSRYRAAFQSNGWSDIVMTSENVLSPLLAARTHRRFAAEDHWDWLSFTLLAKKRA